MPQTTTNALLVLGLLVLFTTLCSVTVQARVYRPKTHIGALNEGLRARGLWHPSSKDSKGALPGGQWFTQALDHFDSLNNQTWQQQYLVNASFYTPNSNSPVFFVLGGEGALSAAYVTGHFIVNMYAQQFGALIVALEHRFYGASVPNNDSSTQNLQFLSSQQALADAAAFRQFIAQRYNTGTGPWIVFGGSYSGNLSAWLKMKYPHLFVGSIATSAPVLAEVDFYQYFQVVQNSVGPTCANIFSRASQNISQLLTTAQGLNFLAAAFNTCSPITNDNERKLFVSALTDGPSGVVQYNDDNVNYQPFNITTMCKILSQHSDPVMAWANLTLTFQAGQCLEVNYTQYMQEMQPTSDARSWTYQTCIEFGYFQAADGANQPFPPILDLEFSIQQCNDIFGRPFYPDITWSNTFYGNVNIQTTNTFMPNGNVDPWHILGTCFENVGPGRDIGPGSATLLIDGTAHCADLYDPRDSDVPGLVAAREIEAQLLKQWIYGTPTPSA